MTWLQVSSLVCNLPLSCNFIQYNRFFQKTFFDLDVGFGAYPQSEKNPRFFPPSSGSTGKYRQKRVKHLVIENLKATWFSEPFVFLLEMNRITRNSPGKHQCSVAFDWSTLPRPDNGLSTARKYLLAVKPFAERQQMPWG